MSLPGGRGEGGGKGERKRGGNSRKKCFPKKWFGIWHSRVSALVPAKGEWKLLCWVAAVFFCRVFISPSSSFSLVTFCSSTTTLPKHPCLSLLPLPLFAFRTCRLVGMGHLPSCCCGPCVGLLDLLLNILGCTGRIF